MNMWSGRRCRSTAAACMPAIALMMLGIMSAWAEPEDSATTKATASGSAAAPAEIPPLARAASAVMRAATHSQAAVTGEARFTSQDRWQHAGYNLDEIIYTVFITNVDSRILRCRTVVHATYINNGQRNELTDLQTTIVHPDDQGQAGIWAGLDEASGATFKVTCKPIPG